MEELWKKLYQDLQAELSLAMTDEWPEEKQIIQCFGICHRFLGQIRVSYKDELNSFYFRRSILPFFLAEAEYYTYLSFVYLFCPKDNTEGRRLFIQREESRLTRFHRQHNAIISNFESGTIDIDKFPHPGFETILSGWIALKKYIAFLRSKI